MNPCNCLSEPFQASETVHLQQQYMLHNSCYQEEGLLGMDIAMPIKNHVRTALIT